MSDDLRIGIREALDTLVIETGQNAEALFGERASEPARMSPTAAHAFGTIEGAALGLGVTALELLDELGL